MLPSIAWSSYREWRSLPSRMKPARNSGLHSPHPLHPPCLPAPAGVGGGFFRRGRRARFLAVLMGLTGWIASLSAQSVVINEIYYHPPSGNPQEEFIEVYNPDTRSVDLEGWRFVRGIDFTFPRVTLPAGGFLVVAADPEVFRRGHPGAANPVGGWTGRLSRGGERLELTDRDGATVDVVTYADEGDWGVRWLTADWLGIPSWEWFAMHDGEGSSLELIDAGRDRDCGQNWGPSRTAGGSPGLVNTISRIETAPFITDVVHSPAVPRSTDAVTITARVRTRGTEGVAVMLRHRVDGAPDFASLSMRDDGQAGDALANDGLFTAMVPHLPAGTVVEFYLEATSAGGATRRWPAIPIPVEAPAQNLLYQVDDAPSAGSMPLYRLIMTEADRVVYTNRVATQPGMFNLANTSATFISWVDGEYEVRYQAGVRNRGQGSRVANFMSFRVEFPGDKSWRGVGKIHLNAYAQYAQVLGSALCQLAGLAMPESRAVQVRLNNGNPATPGWPRFGFYAHNEAMDGDYADRHQLGQANVYRCLRDYSGREPDLTYRGESPQAYTSDYFKETNQSDNDWSDLIALTRTMDPAQTPDDRYPLELEKWVAITNWARFFAMNSFLVNRETSLGNGIGDDYAMYRDAVTGQFHLVPWDLDTILNEGDTRGAADTELFEATRLVTINRFLKHPRVAPLFYAEFQRLAETVFEPARFAAVVSQVWSGVVDQEVIDRVVVFGAARRAYILGRIPRELTVEHGLTTESGYLKATNQVLTLQGKAPPITTRAVLVSGIPATWSAWESVWRAPAVPLFPGINHVHVQALDGAGEPMATQTLVVWHPGGASLPVTGSIAADTAWTPADGPRVLSGDVVVEAPATLRLGAGATVYFEPGARLLVRGRLRIEGTEAARVQFASLPGVVASGAIRFENSAGTNVVRGLDLDLGDNADPVVTVLNSRVHFDGVSWAGSSTRTALAFEHASLRVERCEFRGSGTADAVMGVALQPDGELVLTGNRWTNLSAEGCALRFLAAGPTAAPIVTDNVFSGSKCNALRLAGTDAVIEGNRFNGVPGSSGAAVAVLPAPRVPPQFSFARNQFAGLDRAVVVETEASLVFHNNTFWQIGQAAVEWVVPAEAGATATQVHGINNLFEEVGTVLAVAGATAPDLVSWEWSLFAATQPAAGTGNRVGEARLAWTGDRLVPGPGSEALGQGWAGWDIGGHVLAGITVRADVVSPTPAHRATFHAWGPGVSSYSLSLDGGAFGPAQSVAEPLLVEGLKPGEHAAVGRGLNGAGVGVTSAFSDRVTWTVEDAASALLLNEVQAPTQDSNAVGMPTEGWIELINRGDQSVPLAGLGLTDDKDDPYRYRFPAGTVLAPGQYLVLDSTLLGFKVSPRGETVRLTAATEPLRWLDQVELGPQVDGRSVGRDARGKWRLTWPTPGSINLPCPTGDPANLRLNEWLARGRTAADPDFVELYNRDPLPVGLDGLYLSDFPGTAPTRQRLPALGFVAGRSWLALFAGEDPDRGGLGFNLTTDQGTIGLLDPVGKMLDAVWYPPQRAGVSMGRSPDAADSILPFEIPLPGAANVPFTGDSTNAIPLVVFGDAWKLGPADVLPGLDWPHPDFDDGTWTVGATLYSSETAALPAPVRTPVEPGPGARYFRTRFHWPLAQVPDALRLYTIVDDGAVIHLNGEPVLWLGMPPGVPAGPATPAIRTVPVASVEGPFSLPAARLVPGENTLAVSLHQAGTAADDVVFGLRLEAVVSNLPPADVRLSEVLADNRSALLPGGYDGDWIEIANFSPYPAHLAGMSVEDGSGTGRHVFPGGTWIGPGHQLVLRCDPDSPASATNTGFGLSRSGDGVQLFRPGNGSLVDSIRFGFQAPDVSLARSPEDPVLWGPAVPTPGATNVLHLDPGTGNLRINEWMARPATGDDWFELSNGASRPVNVGGLYLTDDPATPTKHRIADYSIIAAGWFRHQRLAADGNTEAGADHVGFRLSADGDSILLFDNLGTPIDQVTFGSQAQGVSEGRLPDGGTEVRRLPGCASPGAANYLDSDFDGLADDWELDHGFNAQVPDDPEADEDDDGAGTYQEFLAGTDPRDRADLPRLDCLTKPGQTALLRFVAQPGRSYVIEASPAITAAGWERIAGFKARSQRAVHELPLPGAETTATFYRLRID